MNFNYFIDHYKQYLNCPILELELLSRLKELNIVKGTYVLNPGDICKYVYYVKSGFFRVFKGDGFDEETIDFAAPGHLATAIPNFLIQQSQREGIVCEENARVLRISHSDWLALENLSPKFINLGKLILQAYLQQVNTQKNLYRTSNASQKYQYLTQHYKGIARIVSQKNIASYLGITAPTLSNLLKTMLKKPKG
ncbi:Crp/Fnr family transcriptional regulator [Pedobacter polaris]|uniref:Crp/Fnr family transcriptional regulator n=1 Tax=Pedobacter polaris TaxID=2571273 RepID=A0A4V5P000_9SPHI|nr:Crp/Fnr family transcriptional regulator [Pedobacter polaris]TKC10662.1 Crp/Fnr family transcriptional regulator [Pedobacter polaris]